MRRILIAAASAAALGFASTTAQDADSEAQPAAQEDAILVLDGSGSMWGQIDGVTKIEIARDTIGGLLDDMPASRRLGLMAYGHNRKGDCTDIELLADVGADRDVIRAAVDAINPKGKTPLSDAVRQAAEQLKYTENKATVILVSDGIETCDIDPCALGEELEANGVDFTAHVIGFDVAREEDARAQLQCLAENTGGRFLEASNADELTAALQETVVEEAAPEPEPSYEPFLRDEPGDAAALGRRVDELEREANRAFELADLYGVVDALSRLGEIQRILGLDATKVLEQTVELAVKLGDVAVEHENRIRLATARFYIGEHTIAELELRELIEDAHPVDPPEQLDVAYQQLGKCLAEVGLYESAQDMLERALALHSDPMRTLATEEALEEVARRARVRPIGS